MLPLATIILLVPHFAFAISLHEYAHAWMAVRLGDPGPRFAGRLTLNPLKHLDVVGTLMLIFIGIGFAKPVMVDSSRFRDPVRGMMWVALAGPGSNLLAAGVLAGLYRGAGGWFSPVAMEFVYLGVWLNVALAFFNLLPVPPLDGSRIVRALAGWRIRRFLDQLEGYGFVIVILMSYMGLLGGLVFRPTRAVVNLLLGA